MEIQLTIRDNKIKLLCLTWFNLCLQPTHTFLYTIPPPMAACEEPQMRHTKNKKSNAKQGNLLGSFIIITGVIEKP